MALFKILKGNEANLPSSKHEGWAYVTEKGNMYVDLSADRRVKIGNRADSAEYADKATGDTKTIREKYLAKIKQVTSNGTTFTFRGETGDGSNAADLITIPLAGDKAGLISNAAQTIKGIKTFSNGISFPDVSSTAYPAKSVGLTWSGSTDGAKIYYEVQASDKGMLILESTDDTNAGAIFRNSNSGKTVSIVNGIVTGAFTGNLNGTANNAISDNAGKTITSYVHRVTKKSPTVFTVTKGDGTANDIALEFLPTAGGTVHGELYADSITAGSLIVTGVARFTNGLLGNLTGNVIGNVTGNLTGTATNATKDAAGNIITNHYVHKIIQVTSNGTTFTFRGQAASGDNLNNLITIPAASASVAGLITNAAQTLAGLKTFSGGITVSNTSGFNYSGIETASGDSARPIWFAHDTKNGTPVVNASKFTYNPSTNTLVVGNIKLNGLDIANNYLTSVEKSGTISIKTKTGDGTEKTFTLEFLPLAGGTMVGNIAFSKDNIIQWSRNSDFAQIGFKNDSDSDTDSYMYFHTGDNGNEYFKFRITSGSTVTDVLNIKNGAATFNGTVTATKFIGALQGTADYASKAQGDTTTIRSTYIASIKQVTSDGTTFTFRGYAGDGSEKNDLITIPVASTSKAGLITTGAQTIAGEKTLTNNLSFSNITTGVRGIIGTIADNDFWRIVGGANASNQGYLEIATADDANEPIYVRQYSGAFANIIRTLTLLDASGNTRIPGSLYDRNSQELRANLFLASLFQKTSNGTTFTFGGKSTDDSELSTITIPNASATVAGLITNAAQTLAGDKTFTGQLKKAGVSSAWITGRDNAFIRMTSISGYSPAISIKTTNGSWDIGAYDESSYTDDLVFSYCTDANYNAGNNGTTAQIKFLENGHIVAALDGNASTATKATQDDLGQKISSTYVKSVALKSGSNYIIQVVKGDGTSSDVSPKFASSSSCGGAADSANILNGHAEANVTTNSGTGKIRYSYNVNNGTAGLFSVINNANGILTINRHDGNYYSQLGFSSNGKLYYRSFSNTSLNTTQPWKELVFTDGKVANATTAEKDTLGNNIAATYIKSLTLVNNATAPTYTLTKGDGTTSSVGFPIASETYAGLVTAADQSFAGTKRFNGALTLGAWSCAIKCATWSRVCYIPFIAQYVGSGYIIQIQAVRDSVVYNQTFSVSASHSQKGCITALSGTNYSSIQVRVIVDSNGNSYFEVYDNAREATNATTQTVYCRIVGISSGAITKYTSFTDGSTIPSGFAATTLSVDCTRSGLQTKYVTADDIKAGTLKVTGTITDKNGNEVAAALFVRTLAQKSLSTSAYIIKGVNSAGDEITALTLPNATTAQAGLMTAVDQTFAGKKTFTNHTYIKYGVANLYIHSTSTAADSYSIIRLGTSSGENGGYIFLNGPSRTGDGGANLMTIRNNFGNLRLNNNTVVTGTLAINQATAQTSNALYVNGSARIKSTNDSPNSQTTTASMIVDGGVTVMKQVSAKSVRIDNNDTAKGCTVKFNETGNYIEFVFD